ncbi:hypothetical protein CORC01_12506 [Colletotrichum orchidophilum]|uniref:Uncharacterized protein n=1 Tax=Colletotrichum orchidophilum TaxID=1209926 RepID=A0A1G4AT41_9PEZI|nr:uncharacterized protein CORC01_12506 [Colletotrichum orchidophilum]OHE92212.1 hypothetical protein CORC01_12506 [Colletotrichum orchidophilum]
MSNRARGQAVADAETQEKERLRWAAEAQFSTTRAFIPRTEKSSLFLLQCAAEGNLLISTPPWNPLSSNHWSAAFPRPPSPDKPAATGGPTREGKSLTFHCSDCRASGWWPWPRERAWVDYKVWIGNLHYLFRASRRQNVTTTVSEIEGPTIGHTPLSFAHSLTHSLILLARSLTQLILRIPRQIRLQNVIQGPSSEHGSKETEPKKVATKPGGP